VSLAHELITEDDKGIGGNDDSIRMIPGYLESFLKGE
jgi:hypothetical protein